MEPVKGLISICIPAYKRVANMDRLLQTIRMQTFKKYEVVLTDDSPDDSLQALLEKYSDLNIRYYKNEKALGTPANWNYAISLAKGEWIKLMHDDDYFSSAESLAKFADATGKDSAFIFSAYNNVFLDENGRVQPMHVPAGAAEKVIKHPMLLLANNIIGPPSVTLLHASIKERYDEAMKWRVDIDYYVSVLKKEKTFFYINEPLVNVGISTSQVTNYCINEPEVELPEGYLLLKKHGIKPLQHVLVYDAWWRILRNINIRHQKELQQHMPHATWPTVIHKMINHQSKINSSLLRKGIFSKMAMFGSYLLNQRFIKDFN